jgi:uncharacterized protein involved in outer membrane biogenesis
MKTLFRWAFRLLILLVVLLVAGILLLDPVAREVIEYKFSKQTGLEADIRSVDVGILNPRVTLEGIKIYNRTEFGGSPMLEVPELHVEYDRQALRSGKIHLPLVRLNIARLNIVENTNGLTNLKEALGELRKSGGAGGPTNHGASAHYDFTGIDTLNLTFATAEFQSLGDPALNETLSPRVQHQQFTKVNTGAQFSELLNFLLLRSGINPFTPGTNHTDRRWDHWREKLGELGHNK